MTTALPQQRNHTQTWYGSSAFFADAADAAAGGAKASNDLQNRVESAVYTPAQLSLFKAVVDLRKTYLASRLVAAQEIAAGNADLSLVDQALSDEVGQFKISATSPATAPARRAPAARAPPRKLLAQAAR